MKRILIALLIASLTLCLFACAAEDANKGETSEVTTEGITTEGDTAEGNTTEGGTTEDDTTEGTTTEGATTEGTTTEGTTTEAETAEHEHSYSETVVAPTCSERGYTTYTCPCGFSYDDNYKNTVAHTFGDWKTVTAPAVGKTGKAVRECGVCGAEEEKVLDALPSGTDITVVASPGTIARGNKATVTIKGAPNTEYSIKVIYSSGASSAKGLENKVSDANGIASWTWTVSSRTKTGTFDIKIEGGGKSTAIKFTVTE